jgi:hypothetical protein
MGCQTSIRGRGSVAQNYLFGYLLVPATGRSVVSCIDDEGDEP